MRGLIFVGMVGPGSHNQEEHRFVQELSTAFGVTYYLRGAGIKGIRLHQVASIPSRMLCSRNSRQMGNLRYRSLLLVPLRRAAGRLNVGWIHRQLQQIMANSPEDWTIWVRFPSPELVAAIDQMPAVQVVYEPIDLYSAAEDLTAGQAESLLAAEARLIRRATVVTGGMHLADRFRKAMGGSHWLPFGRDMYQQALGMGVATGIPKPRLALVGCLDWRVDEELLVSLMSQHPRWQLILAGPRTRPWGARLKRLPNVHWLGPIPVGRVRSVIRDCDVTLIPYRMTDWTRHCLPVKVFEYLGEGKPVVATPLAELDLARDAVVIASAESFGEAVQAALAGDGAAAEQDRRRFADRYTLQDRARRAVELIHGKALEAVAR